MDMKATFGRMGKAIFWGADSTTRLRQKQSFPFCRKIEEIEANLAFYLIQMKRMESEQPLRNYRIVYTDDPKFAP